MDLFLLSPTGVKVLHPKQALTPLLPYVLSRLKDLDKSL